MYLKIDQNTLRAIRFEQPDYIPMVFWINPACWSHYPKDALIQLMSEHPLLFTDFDPEKFQPPELAPWERAGRPYTDSWGCTWETAEDGLTGVVNGHPLADWDKWAEFTPPDAAKTDGMAEVNWDEIRQKFEQAKSKGEYGAGGLEHGHMFLRLTYLRGYENILFDMTDGDPRLGQLIEMIENFSMEIVKRYLELEAAVMYYPEDLGMQMGPMLSPENFRKYIKPVYNKLSAAAREKGALVHMHSDGDIRTLAEDIIDSGVDVLNLQDMVNGIDWIGANLKGRVCIDLDIDRQQVTRFGSPVDIEKLIREEVEKLGSREGGLMMIYGLYPQVPLENVKALMDALERHAVYYA